MSAASLHILLVEDDALTQDVMMKMLSRRGHRVAAASDGKRALEIAKTQTFDLLISDIGLPDIMGFDLVKMLRALQPQLRAIAVSGYSDDAAKSRAVGFEQHVLKPAPFAKIEAAISQVFPPEAGAAGG